MAKLRNGGVNCCGTKEIVEHVLLVVKAAIEELSGFCKRGTISRGRSDIGPGTRHHKP
jgi:hypothetical protein